MTPITLIAECSVVSEANRRGHWRHRFKRFDLQKTAVYYAWKQADVPDNLLPVKVTLTRIGVGKLDRDNLAGSFKAVQDQVAKMLGCDDGDESAVKWEYAQRPGTRRGTVEIRIEPCDRN